MTTRRDAIKKLGGLAALAGLTKFLPACGDDTSTDGEAPDAPPEVVGITTYVYLMMENRSYDHYLGARSLEGKPGDGITAALANPDLGGTPVNVYAATRATMCDLDPPHSWDAAHLQFNAGAMDGFLTEHQKRHPGDTAPMKYMTRDLLPVTWTLADHYTTCDRWFSAVMGPTWPNRFYWHTGTSNGIKINDVPDFQVTWPTVLHRLEEKGIDWAHYYANITVAGLVAESVNTEGRLHDFGNFINDALAGTLPQVSFIEPGYFLNDDHPPLHPANGQDLIETIYRALAMSPQWKNCLLVVVYDEGGGYYDHVAPPTTADEFAAEGFDQLGSRIPALVVGPYVKQGYVSSVVYNHASGLKQLEATFALAPLTQRVTAANDLTDCIDMDRLSRGEWAPPIELPNFASEDWEMAPICFGDGERQYVPPRPGDCAVHDWANANPAVVAATDRRGHEREYLEGIQRFLKSARPAKKRV